ncbi:MAG: hypothetical protein H0U49_01635 [Parachlamydiaceae bacterium]|nr:hypothetical protein [Parachlamydiaceae bacterium]
MSTNPVAPSAPPPSGPSAADPTTAGAAASSNTPVVNSSTKISSLADLKTKAPKVYNMMMQSLVEMVRRDLQNHAENLKKAYRKGRED